MSGTLLLLCYYIEYTTSIILSLTYSGNALGNEKYI